MAPEPRHRGPELLGQKRPFCPFRRYVRYPKSMSEDGRNSEEFSVFSGHDNSLGSFPRSQTATPLRGGILVDICTGRLTIKFRLVDKRDPVLEFVPTLNSRSITQWAKISRLGCLVTRRNVMLSRYRLRSQRDRVRASCIIISTRFTPPVQPAHHLLT